MQKHLVFIACSIACCTLAPSVQAQPSDQPTAAERDNARELMDTGRKQRANNDLSQALASFTAANRIMHVPTTLFAVAETEAALGRLIAARQVLEELTRLPVEGDEPEAFVKARSAGDALRASLDQRIPLLELVIEGDIADAPLKISVDGALLADDVPIERLPVDPGKHLIVVTSGNRSREANIKVAEGELQRVDLVFDSATKPAPPVAKRAEGPSHWVAYSLAGLGIAGLGAGVALGAQAQHTHSSLEKSCAPTCSDEEAARVGRWATASNVSFGVGAASLAAAVIVYVVQSGQSDKPAASAKTARAWSVQLLPSLQGQGASLQAAGRF